jgi:hypothetical protein
MNPFLERHCGDVHHRLIQYACDALQPALPPDLLARIEERVFVESQSNRARQIIPDVRVSEGYSPPTTAPGELHEDNSSLAEPIVFDLDEVEIVEGYITVREAGGEKVITVIEFLSPANKRPGAGQEKYLEKQSEILGSHASFVEIDLVRAGQHVLALPPRELGPQHAEAYLACISPGWKRSRRELYVLPLRQRLPALPIPLRAQETRIQLDLQALVDQAYLAGRYDTLDYRVPLEPPVSPAADAWVREILSKSV